VSHALDPVRFDQTDPRARGRAHGEMWREPIAALADLRLGQAVRRSRFASPVDVRTAAAAHLPLLQEHLPALHAELLGIAEGANMSAEDIVVLNQFSDLCDVPPSAVGATESASEIASLEGNTSVYYTGVEGPVMGQTWDLHPGVDAFARVMSIEPRDSGQQQLCFTMTGCLGMAGIGQDAVAVTVNNLSSTDGTLGVPWPALLRAMIASSSAKDARDQLLALPRSSGHYYTIADGRDFFGYETSGELAVLTQTGPRAAHLHTNHCFDPVLRQREAVHRGSSSFARLNMATTLYAQQRPSTLDELWSLLGSHDGASASRLCAHSEDDADMQACGRIAMRLRTGELRVARGCADADSGLDLKMHRYNAPPELPPGNMSRFATVKS